MRTSAP